MSAELSGPVVVGVDGSPDSRAALHEATRRALAERLGLVVVHAVGLTATIEGRHVPSFGHGDEIGAQLDRWCDDVRALGIANPERRLVDGPPVDVLLRVACDVGASTIVVGRRGVGGRPELLLGSTAHQVIEHARCPVLVVPSHPTATSDDPV